MGGLSNIDLMLSYSHVAGGVSIDVRTETSCFSPEEGLDHDFICQCFGQCAIMTLGNAARVLTIQV